MNAPLQARAGRNSPEQSLAPEYTGAKGILQRLLTAAAPGVNQQVAEGGLGLLSPTSIRAFMGANVGLAAITLTATVRDPDGNVVETEVGTLGPGANTAAAFAIGALLPEGYTLWLNSTLTAGAYGNDACFTYSLIQTKLPQVGPVDLSTVIQTVVEAAEGHTKFLGAITLRVYNRDTIAHNVEVYVTDPVLGDVQIALVAVGAGLSVSFSPPLIFNSGQQVRARIPVAIATAGRSVTVVGGSVESNLLDL